MLLDGGAVPTGDVSKVLTVLPIGGTVAMGSVCILDTALTIGGTATVGNTCVRVPASTGCRTGTCFLIDVLPSPVCTEAWACAVEGAAILTAVCWGCMPGPRVGTATTCWAGREQCKAGVSATTGAADEERGAGTDMTGLGRATADGPGITGKEDRGPENLGKGDATAGEMVDEHSACVGAPAANLIVVSAEPRGGTLVATGETKAGTLPNLGGDETRVDVPIGGTAKLPACVAGNLGRADTTFVLLGNNVEPRLGVPVNLTGVTLGVVASKDERTAGVHATKGELMAGTPGSLTGDWGKTGGARGATEGWLAPWGGTNAPVLVALAVGTCCGAGLEMIRTWLPGPKPWGGTTKRVLLRRICVPAARGVEVLMTILCWIVPVAEVVNGMQVDGADERGGWVLLRTS